MTDFDKQFDEAIELEKAGKYRDAVEAFAYLFNYGGERAWECLWHEGVNWQRLHNFDYSEDALTAARDMAPNDVAMANVGRDLAETLSEQGDFESAKLNFEDSLELLPTDEYPVEHAATLGMLCRHLMRTGEYERALGVGRMAVTILKQQGETSQLLYAMLNLSELKVLVQDFEGSKETARRAMPLAKQETWKHWLRAWLLAKGLRTRYQIVKRYAS